MSKHPPKKRLRRVLLTLLSLLVVAGLLLMWQTHRMEKSAFRLAEVGRTVSKSFSEMAHGIKALDPTVVTAFYADSYKNEAQGSWTETLDNEADGVRVFAWSEEEPRVYAKADMDKTVTDLLNSFASVHFAKFKLSGMEQLTSDKRASVRATLWLRGKRDVGDFEIQAHFLMDLSRAGEHWQITRQKLLRGKTVIGSGSGFTDIVAQAGLADVRLKYNPMFNVDPDWTLDGFPIVQYSSAGVSAADYDGDGWDDLFFPNGAAAQLFRNQGDGTFKDVTVEAGLTDNLIAVNVGVFADLDNDGDQDLFVGRFTLGNKLFANNGDGTFTDVSDGTDLTGPIVAVASASDYDNDGDLDLYLGRYLDPRTDLPDTPFYTRNGVPNTLLRNDGNFKFTDVTQAAGVGDVGLSLGTAWADYDKDGDQDLYVANDFGRNTLYRNNGDGTFADISEEAGAIDLGFGMSASWGDVDDDGDLDIYVANVHSGQRWYGQAPTLKNYVINSIQQGTFRADLPLYKELLHYLGPNWSSAGDHIIKGNSLLLNDGSGHFEDVSVASNSNPFGWYWGSTFYDFDNDGDQDIYSANGWITATSKDDY